MKPNVPAFLMGVDLTSLSEEEFFAKYGVSKAELRMMTEKLRTLAIAIEKNPGNVQDMEHLIKTMSRLERIARAPLCEEPLSPPKPR